MSFVLKRPFVYLTKMSWLSIISLSIFAYFLWSTYTFIKNYIQARKLDVPIILSPINPINPIWVLSHKRLLPYLKSSPWDITGFVRYSYVSWPFFDRYRIHEKLGPAFALVHPAQVELYVADGEAIDTITSRRKDFTKPFLMYRPVEVFGKNVDTVEGAEWQRHRKITTPPFNERNSGLVWKESLRQAEDMMKEWSECGGKGTVSTCNDTMTLALHVLTSAGFGMSYSFKTGPGNLPAGHTLSYRDALAAVLHDIIPMFILPLSFFTLPFLPPRVRRIGTAITEFKAYMTEMVDQERRLITKRDPGTGNLMSSLVRASDQANEHALTDDEILGNIFIYNLAGHETTANTLAYTIHLLAVYPTYQDWLHEELVHILGDQETLNYEKHFPQLKRCLATMYETLRLYSPISALPKTTNDKPQPLTINGKQHIIPARTWVQINQVAVHTLPKYWGQDSLHWLPDRWIAPTTGNGEDEVLKDPPGGKGTFIPWAEGPRICPGKKFAQVEFVAVLATLLRKWRVRPRVLEGESMEQARKRVLAFVEDSEVVITLQMKKAKSVCLVWESRRGEKS